MKKGSSSKSALRQNTGYDLARGLLELENAFSAAAAAQAVDVAVNKVSQETGVGHGPLVAGIIGSSGR